LPLSRAYATSRISTAPSGSSRTLKGSAVVTIGVDRHGAGGDDGTSVRPLFSRRGFLGRLLASPYLVVLEGRYWCRVVLCEKGQGNGTESEASVR
jgi:hypothetical protein